MVPSSAGCLQAELFSLRLTNPDFFGCSTVWLRLSFRVESLKRRRGNGRVRTNGCFSYGVGIYTTTADTTNLCRLWILFSAATSMDLPQENCDSDFQGCPRGKSGSPCVSKFLMGAELRAWDTGRWRLPGSCSFAPEQESTTQ